MIGSGKIAGHSGTDFKPKKAYFSKKMPYPSKTKKEYPTITTNYKPTASVFNQNKYDRWIKLGLGLPAFLIFVALIGFGIQFYGNPLRTYTNTYGNRTKVAVQKNKEAEYRNAYNIFMDEGNMYLNAKEWDAAQAAYYHILKMDKYDIAANIGLTKTLLQKCKQYQELCETADEYVHFLQKMNYASKEEIATW